MKVHSALAASLVLAIAASSAAADVACEGVIGVLPVVSSGADTIVAVPWLASGVGDSSISVSNIVQTANLAEGDLLYWYDAANKNYQMWMLTNGEDRVSVPYWQSVSKVSSSGVTVTPASDALRLARGSALLLHRQNPSANGGVFYLSGQVASAGASSPVSTVAASPAGAPADVYTLIAPPNAAATDLNSISSWNDSCANDKIYISANTALTYENGSWGLTTYNAATRQWTRNTSAATVPAGQGVWYVRGKENAGSDLTVTW